MSEITPPQLDPKRISVECFLHLFEEGALGDEDRVEPLEGVIVAVTPPIPPLGDHWTNHPRSALLLVEIADSSVKQDRLSKARIYAAANVPEYWIVNLRESVIEVMRDPEPTTALYRDTRIAAAGETLALAALPGARVAIAELLPAPR